jgi:hypothetical protein
MAPSPIRQLLDKLDEYKRKYYLNRLLKGLIFSAAALLSAYLLVNTLEYFGRFSTPLRATLFFLFLATLGFTLVFWILKPAFFLLGRNKPLSNEEAARQVGRYFPEVGDKLLNTLQLANLTSSQNELLLASIQQKSQQLGYVRFADAINLNQNRQYLKFALAPALAILGILFVSPKFFTTSSTRIVHFANEYAEEAPFTFVLENRQLQAFKGEDFTINLRLKGGAMPEAVYLLHNGRRLRMDPADARQFAYTFHNIQKAFDFQFEAAGYKSPQYEVELVSRPSLAAFEVTLHYPSYLNKPGETLKNVGNLTVPEGTVVRWEVTARDADSVVFRFENEKTPLLADKSLLPGGDFELEKRVRTSSGYQVSLRNAYAINREGIQYFLNVIPDKHPTITLEQYRDSTLYNLLVLGGNIADDYGLSQLRVFYKIVREGAKAPEQYASFGLPINRGQVIQSYFKQWETDSLKLSPGDKLEYFVQVWDNDGVNGPKPSRTGLMTYAVPSRQAVEKELDNAAEKTAEQLDKTLNKAQQLQKELAALENRLRNKRDFDFQDKRQLEELLKKREQLMNEIRQMQEQNKSLTEKQQRFSEQNPELAQKMEQLQKLMNEVLNQDTNKLYEELKNLMEKNQDERMLDMIERLKNKEKNTEKELERALALFKKLQLEQKLDKSIDELKKLAEKQDQLSDKTQKADANDKADQKPSDAKNDPHKADEKDKADAKNQQDDKKDDKASDPKNSSAGDKKDDNDGLKQQQEQLKQEMDEVKKDLNELEQLSKEDENQSPMDTDQQKQESITQQQQQSQQQLSKNDKKNAAKSQKNAAQQMQQLADKLSNAKQEMEMEETQENMDDLRDILENLVTLSFDQERVMKEFRGVNLADPRFVKLSQEQLKLQDDAKIIEDSLHALSKRVLQIESFVTRELTNMKYNMDESVRYIRERRIPQATSKQQFAMSSINNLALLLSDVLKQMQENMASMMMASGKSKGQKKKGNTPSPGLGKRQQQLGQQMQQLKQSGQQGRGLSEQLARLAAEQAQIRKMLKQLLDAQKGTETGRQLSNEVNELLKKMEENEEDLVNKRITPNTFNRQKDIQIRLLESEKALREQEEDSKRKAETAHQVPRKVPPQFEEYVRQKQSQTELLRTVPPALAPFYKREVDTYFRKLR